MLFPLHVHTHTHTHTHTHKHTEREKERERERERERGLTSCIQMIFRNVKNKRTEAEVMMHYILKKKNLFLGIL